MFIFGSYVKLSIALNNCVNKEVYDLGLCNCFVIKSNRITLILMSDFVSIFVISIVNSMFYSEINI